MFAVATLCTALASATSVGPSPAPTLEAQPTHQEPEPRRFNLKRAGLELGAAMAIGVTWYQTQIEINKRDFDFDRTWSDQWRRLSSRDGWRFDDNERYLNVGHAFMGLYYHQFARANHATMLQAAVFDLVTSSVWELAVEHREVFSLNDTVVTTVGGIPLGETFFQIGDFFARSEPNWRNRTLMALFSPARALGMLDGSGRIAPARNQDRQGMAANAYHRFDFGAGAALASGPQAQPEMAARLDLELVNLPSFGQAVNDRRRLRGGEATRLLVDYTGAGRDLSSLTMLARSSLLGYQRQAARDDASGQGTGALLTAVTAFDLSYQDEGTFTDFLANVHVLGPSADLSLYRGPLWLRFGADVFGDFAMVRPFALQTSTSFAAAEQTKAVLRRWDYYYALGLTAAARVEAKLGRARAGASLEWNGFDSIEGLDRHQHAYVSPTGVQHAAIAQDLPIDDQRLKLRLFADAPVPRTGAKVALTYDRRHRSGTLGGEEQARSDERLSLLLVRAL